MSALRFYISFHASLKNSVYYLKLQFHQNPSLSNEPQTNHFKIGILIYLKTLPKCLKRKEHKKIGFRAKNSEPVKALANWLNRPRYWSTGSFFLVKFGREEQKIPSLSLSLSLSSISLSFSVKRFSFSIDLRLKVTVTCQALNTPTASEPVDPQLDRLRLLFYFLFSQGQKPINRELHFIYV